MIAFRGRAGIPPALGPAMPARAPFVPPPPPSPHSPSRLLYQSGAGPGGAPRRRTPAESSRHAWGASYSSPASPASPVSPARSPRPRPRRRVLRCLRSSGCRAEPAENTSSPHQPPPAPPTPKTERGVALGGPGTKSPSCLPVAVLSTRRSRSRNDE